MAKSYACVFNFFPYHKRLEIHPMGNAKFASKNFYKSFHLYRRLRTKGDLKKLSIQIIEERISNLQSCEPIDWAITGSDVIPISTMASYLHQR